MHQDKYVFSQLVSFLDRSKFNRIVAKYDGDKYVKYFTCWNQLLALSSGNSQIEKVYATLLSLWKPIKGKHTI